MCAEFLFYLCNAKIKRRFRLAARTHASHAWNTGSIPVGATKRDTLKSVSFFLFVSGVGHCLNRVKAVG